MPNAHDRVVIRRQWTATAVVCAVVLGAAALTSEALAPKSGGKSIRAEAFFSPGGGCESRIVEEIGEARKNIRVQMYIYVRLWDMRRSRATCMPSRARPMPSTSSSFGAESRRRYSTRTLRRRLSSILTPNSEMQSMIPIHWPLLDETVQRGWHPKGTNPALTAVPLRMNDREMTEELYQERLRARIAWMMVNALGNSDPNKALKAIDNLAWDTGNDQMIHQQVLADIVMDLRAALEQEDEPKTTMMVGWALADLVWRSLLLQAENPLPGDLRDPKSPWPGLEETEGSAEAIALTTWMDWASLWVNTVLLV